MESLAPAGHTVTLTHSCKLLYLMLIKTSEGDVGQAQKDEALVHGSTWALGISQTRVKIPVLCCKGGRTSVTITPPLSLSQKGSLSNSSVSGYGNQT